MGTQLLITYSMIVESDGLLCDGSLLVEIIACTEEKPDCRRVRRGYVNEIARCVIYYVGTYLKSWRPLLTQR